MAHPLNFEAGQVPMPEDPRECDAACRAGVITYRIFPYYRWRYGERGQRFTRSDSAWLAWLTRHDQDFMTDQIQWLGKLLSNRGMPQWLMEVHLRVLYKKLAAVVPDREQDYVKLVSVSERLREQRVAAITESVSRNLVSDFADRIGSWPSNLPQGTARLIIAAVADEKNGVSNAVASVEEWLSDIATIKRVLAIDSIRRRSREGYPDHDAQPDRWLGAIKSIIKSARDS